MIFKDDFPALSDFFSTISEKTEYRGVKLLYVYKYVLNRIAVKVPKEHLIESMENLPMVNKVENDILTEAFAQTGSVQLAGFNSLL